MKDKIIYLNRYSDTDEPDKQGRWMRLVSYNNLNIGHISIEFFEESIKYYLASNFPVNNNVSSFYCNHFDTYKEAQDKIESLWNEFKQKIL